MWQPKEQSEEKDNSETENLNSSGATDDETGVHVGNTFRVRIVRACKATGNDDIQTLIAARHRTSDGWRRAFFCDSGADVCLVTEAKVKRDTMTIDEEGARKLEIMDVNRDNVKLAGTTVYWGGNIT